MTRTPVLVRDATEEDRSALCRLWADLLPETQGSGHCSEEAAAAAVRRTALHRSSRIVLAEIDGEVVGCVFLRITLASPLDQEDVVFVSHLQTDPDVRDAVQQALLEAAVTWAERCGLATIATVAASADRDTNRTWARLGLAQVGVIRGASVEALRARLPQTAGSVGRPAAASRRSVGQVVAARRSQRRARTRQLVL